jgi:serine/threonine protein kinase HipA of HipAB toxin-antitoxin module
MRLLWYAPRIREQQVRRGAAVTAIVKEPQCWRIEVAGHDAIRSETIFLATGKHDLREWRRTGGYTKRLYRLSSVIIG